MSTKGNQQPTEYKSENQYARPVKYLSVRITIYIYIYIYTLDNDIFCNLISMANRFKQKFIYNKIDFTSLPSVMVPIYAHLNN